MGKTRDLFKKIRDTKGTFHAEIGTIKERNGMDLTEAEDIKKMLQEYTELYKKDLNDSDNQDDVITPLEPDILEYEVNWPLGSITANKASGSDAIPAEVFQIPKDDAVINNNNQMLSVVLNMPTYLEDSAVAIELENISFHPNPKERQYQRMLKLLHNCTHFHASKIMRKIPQARL